MKTLLVMKRTFALAVAVFFVMSLAGVAAAAEKEKLPSLKGEVVSVDSAAKTLTVKGTKGEETIATDDMTKIWMGKQKETFNDIVSGEKVAVRYSQKDGKLLAHSIRITPTNEGRVETR